MRQRILIPALAGSVVVLLAVGLTASGCGGDDTTGGGGLPTGTPTATGGGGTGGTGGSGLTGGGGTGGTGGDVGGSGGGTGGDGGGGGAAFTGHTGYELVNTGELIYSTNYEMVFTLGQPTLHQGDCSSTNYRYIGGLIGVVGDQP